MFALLCSALFRFLSSFLAALGAHEEKKLLGLNEIERKGRGKKGSSCRLVFNAGEKKFVNNLEPLMFVLGKHVDLSSNFRCYMFPRPSSSSTGKFSLSLASPPALKASSGWKLESSHIRCLINNNIPPRKKGRERKRIRRRRSANG